MANRARDVKSIAASAAVDLMSSDEDVVSNAIKLLMECATSIMLNDRGAAAKHFSDRDRSSILSNQALERLVDLLSDKHSLNLRVQASRAVFNLSAASTVRKFMSKAGAVALLVACLMPSQHVVGAEVFQAPRPCDYLATGKAVGSGSSTASSTSSSKVDFMSTGADDTRIRKEKFVSLSSNAMGALANFAVSPTSKLVILNSHAIERIVRVLEQSPATNMRQHACRALFALASDSSSKHNIRQAIVQAGALRPLIKSLRHSSSHVQWHAAGALANLSLDSRNKLHVMNKGGIESFVEVALHSTSDKVQRQIARALFALTCKAEISERLVREGGLTPLVRLLGSRHKDIKRDAAGAIGNIAMSSELKERVVDAGAIPPLVELAKCSIEVDVLREVVRALYVLSYGESIRKKIVDADGLHALVSLSQGRKELSQNSRSDVDSSKRTEFSDVQEKAAGCLANIACGKGNKHRVVRAGGLEPLLKLLCVDNLQENEKSLDLMDGDEKFNAQRQAARAIFALSSNTENQRIIVSMGLNPLLAAMSSLDSAVVHNAAGAVANLAIGDFKGRLVEEGGVGSLLKLSKNPSIEAQKQAIRGLKNLFGEVEEKATKSESETTLSTMMASITDSSKMHSQQEGKHSQVTGDMSRTCVFYDTWSGTRLSIDGKCVANKYTSRLRSVQWEPNAFACERKRMGNDMKEALAAEMFTDLKIIIKRNDERKCSEAFDSQISGNSAVLAESKTHWAIMSASCNYFAELAATKASQRAAKESTGSKDTFSLRRGKSSLDKHSQLGSDGGPSVLPDCVTISLQDEVFECESKVCEDDMTPSEIWKAFVEFAYTGEIQDPYERIRVFYADRKKRRHQETKKKEIRATARKCIGLMPALAKLSSHFGMQGLKPYLDKCIKVAEKFTRRKNTPVLQTSQETHESKNGEREQDAVNSSIKLPCLQRLLDGRLGGYSADIEFYTGDGSSVLAHRAIVCARSMYFRAMLSEEGTFAESHMDKIPVQVESGRVFSDVIHYIYTGQASNLDPDTSFDVLNAAHIYGLAGLQSLCEDHIANSYLDVSNVCEILNATSELPESRLRLSSIAFLLNNILEVVESIQSSNTSKRAEKSLQEVLEDSEQWTEEEKEHRIRCEIEDLPISNFGLLEFIIERAVAWDVVSRLISKYKEPERRDSSTDSESQDDVCEPAFIDLSDPRFSSRGSDVGRRK